VAVTPLVTSIRLPPWSFKQILLVSLALFEVSPVVPCSAVLLCVKYPRKLSDSNNILDALLPLKSATRKIRFLRWGIPQYCASRTRQAIESLSPNSSPAFSHLSGVGISTFSALTLQNFSITLLKSSPLFEEKAPQTFSHTAYLGYSPFVLHLISFIIRI